jgi:drug/metabolite transporter (DMT)-like permease
LPVQRTNSVANAPLIGSGAPFLIVPVGAWLFRENIYPRALVFTLLAFGGVAVVFLSAPLGVDASLEGSILGVLLVLGSFEFVGHFEEHGWKLAGTVVPIAYRPGPCG